MPGSSLLDIKNMVRQLTRTPSPNQLTDANLVNFINTFYVFDFPRELRTPDLRVNINILLNANQQQYPLDQYLTNLAYPNLTDYKQWITSIYPPIYCGGRQIQFTQSQAEFFGYNPKNQQRVQVGTGTGAPFALTATLQNRPVVPGQVAVSALDATGHSIRRQDNGIGGFINELGQPVAGTIDYVLGIITGLDMGTPVVLTPIYAYYNAYKPSWPSMMLLFNNTLSFWPIPDQGYQVTFEADISVADLTLDADQPVIREWWQYIAYGAAIKVLQWRMDNETESKIRPEFERQQDLVNRKLLTQQMSSRTQTIYSSLDSIGPFLNSSFSNNQT